VPAEARKEAPKEASKEAPKEPPASPENKWVIDLRTPPRSDSNQD
jgi:hypothetical protein